MLSSLTYNERETLLMIEVLEKNFSQNKDWEMVILWSMTIPDGTAEIVWEKMKIYPNIELS